MMTNLIRVGLVAGRTRGHPRRPRLETLEDRVVPATLPAGFQEAVAASGLTNPTAMEFSPENRLFVAEQGGTMEVYQDGVRLRENFFSTTPLTVNSSGERGLLGVAFDPNYSVNHHVYVYYTATTPAIHNRLSRFTANAAGDLAVAGSETVLLDLNNLSSATNHNGGAIHFGPDGKLYVAVGDNATGSNSQSLGNLLGKVLRLNADGTIPTDNPFFSTATGNNRAIWALGLRNPFTFAFQAGTGRMFINDVGQSAWEEINAGTAGANYGWPTTEGNFNQSTYPNFTPPFYTYGRSVGQAITGGAFYNPATNQFPADYAGDYFFADYVSSWIKRIDTTTKEVTDFAGGASNPVDLRVGGDGSLYYLARGTGQVVRVRYTASQVPSITEGPASQTVSVGQSATFRVVASGTAPLSYQWQRNGVNISGANGPSYSTASATTADNGARFRAVVSNDFGTTTSQEATLTVVANRLPTATITAPAGGTLYTAGSTITYAGQGTDPEDGILPASAFTWQVDFHHDAHTHPFVPATGKATGGTFTIPTSGETSPNVWYRIHLTVRDSGGLTQTTYVDVTPRTVTVTLATNPGGLRLTLDGQPAPSSFVGVVGMQRSLGALSPQTQNRKTYVFSRWSDGGARSHVIVTPAVNTTYTAFFNRQRGTSSRAALAAPPVVAFPADETPFRRVLRGRKRK